MTNNALATTVASRRHELAMRHAQTLIQQRKSIESTILESLEALIDFPTPIPAPPPSQPSPADLASFRRHVAPFQVSDYDSLIEERNAAKKCGYVFCPRPYKQDASNGKFRILWGNSRGQALKVVPLSQIQRWCSVECARRAMYIKVQLSEVPGWERAGGLGGKIEVLKEADEESLIDRMGAMELDKGEEEGLKDAMAALALERGDDDKATTAAPFANITINENNTSFETDQSMERYPGPREHSHMEIEGYEPYSQSSHLRRSAMSKTDSDWDLR